MAAHARAVEHAVATTHGAGKDCTRLTVPQTAYIAVRDERETLRSGGVTSSDLGCRSELHTDRATVHASSPQVESGD